MTTIISERIAATGPQAKRPPAPQLSVENPYKHTVYLTNLNLVFGPYFTAFGNIEITINTRQIFSSKDQANFRDIRSMNVESGGEKINQGESLNVYIWNDQNTNEISLTLLGAMLKNPADRAPTAIPVDLTTQQAVISTVAPGPDQGAEGSDLHDQLTGVINAITQLQGSNQLEIRALDFDTQGLDNTMREVAKTPTDIGVENTIEDIITFRQTHQYPSFLDDFGHFQELVDRLRDLQDGFDQNELNQTRTYLRDKISFFETAQSVSGYINTEWNKFIGRLKGLAMALDSLHETYPTLQEAADNTLLPKRVYQGEIHNILINTSGRRNFLLVLNWTYLAPTDLGDRSATWQGGHDYDVSLNLSEFNGSGNNKTRGAVAYDFGDAPHHQRRARFNTRISATWTGSGSSPSTQFQIVLDKSDDPDFLDGSTELAWQTPQSRTGEVSYSNWRKETTYDLDRRYVRARYITSGSLNNFSGTMAVDSRNDDNLLGIPQITLEVLAGIWIPLITHEEFEELAGAAFGAPAVKSIEFGERKTGHVIPSTHDRLRINIDLNGPGADLGVDLLMMS